MILTTAQLLHIAPACKHADVYVPLLNEFMPKYDITTPARIRPFLANCAHESSQFNDTLENANPGHLPGEQYEGRADLGNTRPGYGVKFPGRGLIQITGYNAYHDCSKALYGDNRLLLDPKLLEQPEAATQSACWFWKVVKGLNIIADMPDTYTHTYKGDTYNRFEWICFKINGGTNGMAERKAFYQKALEVII